MKTKLPYLIAFLFIGVNQSIYAYLDPGSGSALFTGIIAIITAGFYSIKMLYYKIIGKSEVNPKADNTTPIIFSEGKSYWGTFEPIVKELINQKITFRYISLDVYDPGLQIENDYMISKLYSKTTQGFAKIALIKAPLMLATTPNIGSEGFPLQQPKNVKELVHVFHDMMGGANYRLGSLDFYDTAILSSEEHIPYIRKTEEIRNIKQKKLEVLGLPYCDTLYEKMQETGKATIQNCDKKTILIAPSWGSKGCFSYYNTDFVNILHNAGYNIIIRLHPHSYINEPEKVMVWKKSFSSLTNVIFDEELYSTQSMLKADILISDTSSVRFDFAFLHLKPVITLEIPLNDLSEFESSYHEKIWADEIAEKIGAVITKPKVAELSNTVDSVLNNYDTNSFVKLRKSCLVNFGQSAKHIVNYITQSVEGVK